MAHTLRAASNLKAATALLGTIIAGGVIIVGAGAATPVVLGMSKEGVTNVVNLEDSYTLTYGQDITPIMEKVKVTVGNGFNKEGKALDGTVLKLEGYDSEYIGTKEVIASYMDYSKRINVTINADKLKTPSPQFNSATGILSWEPVNNGETYTVVLTDPANAKEISRSTNQASSYDLNNVGFYTKYDVTVFASNSKKGSNGVSAFIDSDSSQKITLQKLNQVQNLTYDQESGSLKWDAIDASSYEVVINGSTFNPTTNAQAFNMTNPGTYNVSIRGVAGEGAYATPTTATYRRLPTPVLTYASNEISVQDGETLEYSMDGQPFSGDISAIVDPGQHKIKARNISTKSTELPSAWSDELTLYKLEAPTISLTDGKLSATGIASTNHAIWYSNGQQFDGKLASISGVGSFTITAKAAGSGNQITSEASNEIKVTKLTAPIASFNGSEVSFENKEENFRIYIDGQRTNYTEVSDEVINILSDSKVHTVSGVNLGNGNEILDSDQSNIVSFVVPEIVCESSYAKQNEQNIARLRITHKIADRTASISAKVTVEYFKGGAKAAEPMVDSNFEVKLDDQSVGPKAYNMRDADKVVFTIELQDVEGLQMFKRTITKEVLVP